MDRLTAQSRIMNGLTKIAKKLGAEFEWFRPDTPFDPLADRNFMGPTRAYFDPKPSLSGFDAAKAGGAIWYGAIGETGVLPGDILKGVTGTYAIGMMQDFRPPESILCNAVVSIYRPSAAIVDPDDYYGGNTANGGLGQLLARDWPCSILEGSKGGRATLNLPNDAPEAGFDIRMPAIPGVVLQASDVIYDHQRHVRYQISSPEHTAHGYRLLINQRGV